MGRYILKRILLMIPVMIGVLTIVFILNTITPGDVAKQLAGQEATAEEVEAVRHDLGLDQPVPVRYVRYIWGMFTRGDLGTSYVTHEPILNEILARFPTTIKLASLSMLFAILVGVPLGIIAAVKQYSWVDNLAMTVSLLGVSIPGFWLGLMSILLFAVKLHVLPASGMADGWKSWVLPVICCGVGAMATIARTTRSSMLETIRQDYINTAKAKGQKYSVIVIKHALRNALIPVVTLVGAQFGVQLGGAILAETVFAIPGLGSYMVGAIKARNYPAVQGGVVFLSIVFSFINLFVDILYTYIDPRMKTRYQTVKHKKKPAKTTAKAGESIG